MLFFDEIKEPLQNEEEKSEVPDDAANDSIIIQWFVEYGNSQTTYHNLATR